MMHIGVFEVIPLFHVERFKHRKALDKCDQLSVLMNKPTYCFEGENV